VSQIESPAPSHRATRPTPFEPDLDAMTPDERRTEIAALLATGYLRLQRLHPQPLPATGAPPAQAKLSEGERFDLMSGRRRAVIVERRSVRSAEKEKRP
jgi:hypothetical protein